MDEGQSSRALTQAAHGNAYCHDPSPPSTALSRVCRVLPPSVTRPLRRLRDTWRVRRTKPEVRVVAGVSIRIVGVTAFENREYSEELVVFNSLLDQVTCVVDIGANVGYFTQIALGRGAEVVAVEPNPEAIGQLLRGLINCGCDTSRLTVLHGAVTHRSGLGLLHGGGQGASLDPAWLESRGHYSTVTPFFSLAQVLSLRSSNGRALLKIDVEGHEGPVLDGLEFAIERTGATRPFLLFERGRAWNPVVPEEDEVLRKLWRYNYRIFALKEDVSIISAESRSPALVDPQATDGREINFLAVPDNLTLHVNVSGRGLVPFEQVRAPVDFRA
ncbi:MAG: FkbM family methyltransferase [Acidimicrobiia bacterium]